jgi:hypothetical protein
MLDTNILSAERNAAARPGTVVDVGARAARLLRWPGKASSDRRFEPLLPYGRGPRLTAPSGGRTAANRSLTEARL